MPYARSLPTGCTEPDELADGFTSDVFEEVNRRANLSNYNQSVINKEPNLVIQLANPLS